MLSVPEEQINFDVLESELFDFENVWINFDNDLCNNLDFDTDKDEYFLIQDK